jgi:hypothetical protein
MRDITTQRTGGTAPLPGEALPQAVKQTGKPDAEITVQTEGDSLQARHVPTSNDSPRVTIGDPVPAATATAAKHLAQLVLASNKPAVIAKVMARLGMTSEKELQDVAKGKPLNATQLGKLSKEEQGLLLDAVTPKGAEEVLKAILSRDDHG